MAFFLYYCFCCIYCYNLQTKDHVYSVCPIAPYAKLVFSFCILSYHIILYRTMLKKKVLLSRISFERCLWKKKKERWFLVMWFAVLLVMLKWYVPLYDSDYNCCCIYVEDFPTGFYLGIYDTGLRSKQYWSFRC